jgi:hypothetical protein
MEPSKCFFVVLIITIGNTQTYTSCVMCVRCECLNITKFGSQYLVHSTRSGTCLLRKTSSFRRDAKLLTSSH